MIAGYIVGGIFFAWLFFIAIQHGGHIIRDLRGKDNEWHILEVAHLLWIICFPAVIFSALFGNTVEAHIIYGLDLIGAAIIAGNVYKETHNSA